MPLFLMYTVREHSVDVNLPYLAKTFGSTPSASLIMMGVCGLFFFIVGYARLRNDLEV